MNDVLAITLFTIENCLKLLFAGGLSGFYYLLPFSIWFAAIYDPAIPLRCWQQMIALCFRCFADWIARAPRSLDRNHFVTHCETCAKYVAELPDMKRYTNSFLFLYKILRNTTGHIALNRLGTHPVENMFGLVRMKCKSKHSSMSFLRAFSQSMVMTTILQATGLSSPVRRNYTIAGCRILLTPDPTGFYLNPSDFILCFTAMQSQQINQWVSQRDERSLEERIPEFSPVSSSFLHFAEVLILSHRETRPRFSMPGPIANQTILSRLFASGASFTSDAGYILSPSKKRKARALLTGGNTREDLARVAQILACPIEALALMSSEEFPGTPSPPLSVPISDD
jgi:hypothetical protein